MGLLKSIRPSNLVLLAAAPFIIYLFSTSSKYTRSLKAIIGVETGALAQFIGFLLVMALFAGAFAASLWMLRGDTAGNRLRQSGMVALPVMLAAMVAMLFLPWLVLPFAESLVANSVDPITSDWIVPTVRPRQLTPEMAAVVASWVRWGLVAWLVLAVAALGGARVLAGGARDLVLRVFLALNSLVLAYLLFAAHWGFATGIAITFRAAIFAYIGAALLGLGWTGLQSLKQQKWTLVIYGAISVALIAIAAFFFAQPRESYVLVGTTEGRTAIIKGTPQSMADLIRFGEFDGATGDSFKIRSATDVASAVELLQGENNITGAFLPKGTDFGNAPVIWEVEFLADSNKTPALAFSSIGILLLVLTLGAMQHKLHPLAVGAEFFVDTIRGIPMLVIILYIGLPLSGAIKDASGGGIDLTNMTRGIIAIAIGYSAYMAEIFRAGIESIPKGQIEAAQSLGLSRWKVARLIVLPQALRVVIPPLGNEFIAMIKDTSLLSILSVRDVTQRMREFQAASFLPFAPFNTAAILYVVITLACASLLKWIERRYETKGH